MIEPQYPAPSRHQYRFEDFSSSDFERLVYQLVERCGEFEDVEWYDGTRDRGRDVVAYKQIAAGRQKWYFQCKPYVRVTYDVVRSDLDRLMEHVTEQPDFAPDVIILATASPVPTQVTDHAAIYANQLGLPEPYFWDQGALDRMLKSQPETEREFFGLRRFIYRHLIDSTVRAPRGCQIALGLFVLFLVAAGVVLSQRAASPPATPTLHTATHAPTSTPILADTATSEPDRPAPSLTHTPTSTPHTPTDTPMPTPQELTHTPASASSGPTDTPTPVPTLTPTSTPTPTLTPVPTFVLVVPTLLEPSSGITTRGGTIFRWEGQRSAGQSFVLRFRHTSSGWTWDIGPLSTDCWEVTLPAERFGGWSWQVRVVSGQTTLAESEERYFWLDPFPRIPLPVLPTPRPCGP